MAPRLLLVEGHAGVRAALAKRLERALGRGAVAVASTLQAAVAQVQCQPTAALVCDPTTLGGGAARAAEMVRQLSATGVPVITLLPSLADGEEAALRRAGARAVLLKEPLLASLLAAIERELAPTCAPGDGTSQWTPAA
jgi:DNA-binding NarL/FixJ family response regulator